MAELSQRERLWLALSELFLDTESRGELPRLAHVALSSGFSWDMVERIYLEEVAPVAGPNLFDLAGDWAGFPPDWLFAQIRGRAPGTTRISLQATEMLHDQWLVLNQLYHHLAEVPDPQQPQRAQSWLWLASQFLHPAWPDSHHFPPFLPHCLDPQNQPQLAADYLWLEKIYRPLWVHAGDPGQQQIQRNWQYCQEVMAWAPGQPAPLAPTLCALQILFVGPQINPQHPAFPEILERLRAAAASPSQVNTWFESPWANWLSLKEPRRRQWAQANWEHHLLPLWLRSKLSPNVHQESS
ncbi:hypothetical protein JST97_02965 [bacterium]|nr:hypothetical protein [bacterium]